MIYFCQQKNRRTRVLASALNGIDYLEAGSDGVTLTLVLLKPPPALTPAQFVIAGGETVTGITATKVAAVAGQPTALAVTVSSTGDFAPYTLSLVASAGSALPPTGIDPALASVVFAFHPPQDSSVDCSAAICCPPPRPSEPDINYLAKDFPGFQQAMLDRIAVLSPAWQEPHAADLGNTLVELLAYVADHLSYRQDAVATEAYLGTARSRISLRRHARLVDYVLNDGANACTFVHVEVASPVTLPAGTPVLPRVIGMPAQIDPLSSRYTSLVTGSPVVFATMAAASLVHEQNLMAFYTWSDSACCLPAGSTEATLAGGFASLKPNTVLLFEEVTGPDTGADADADPSHRCVVRLVSASVGTDPLTNQAITNIAWDPVDALPFALCISAPAATALNKPVSVARGNMVPADHGAPQGPELLGPVPAPPPTPIAASGCAADAPTAPPPPFFFPSLSLAPLTFARQFVATQPASQLAAGAVRAVISLTDDTHVAWSMLPDLLTAAPGATSFVVEIENDGTTWLRFGDNTHGLAPNQGQTFTARYRSGNGAVGNVGRDSLGHVALGPVSTPPAITLVRNPLPAAGGVDGEAMDAIRARAPYGFRTQLRAVTEANYAAVTKRDTRVADARASFRWTGSWRTAFVSVDPATGAPPSLTTQTQATLELMRMAGTDVVVEGAMIVGLLVSLLVSVAPGYQRSQVSRALQGVFSAAAQPNGQPGLLDPNGFTFGAAVYLSPFVAAAQAVAGVAAVQCTAFRRLDDPATDYAPAGVIPLGRLELARIANDPNRPDHGSLSVALEGGW